MSVFLGWDWLAGWLTGWLTVCVYLVTGGGDGA